MFLRFANFYRRFIQRFSRIATPLPLVLKISGSTESKTRPGEGGGGVGSDSKDRHGGSEIDGSGKDDIEIDSGEVQVDEIGKNVQKLVLVQKDGKIFRLSYSRS